MKIAIVLFPHFTATDAVGPYEVLARLPGATIQFVSSSGGVLVSDNGFLQIVTQPLQAGERPDILVVPGGPVPKLPLADAALLEWVCEADRHSRWTASVCTGSLILGAAGLLRGRRATTHWARLGLLPGYGAEAVAQRVVFDGKYVSGAGVSAGFDMALTLAAQVAGDAVAMAIQLGIEYDPQPPFDAGSPAKAPAAVVEMVHKRLAGAA